MTKECPFISIIVTAYNIENYLPACLDSILAQTYENFELLLVDDGSTDRSGIICDEYVKKDLRIRVIHQENKGVSDAWNEAVKQAKGAYTGFVDGDDIIHLCMYELLYQAVEETRSDLAYCSYRQFYHDDDLKLLFDRKKAEPDTAGKVCVSSLEKEMLINVDIPMVWRGLYKTDLIRTIPFLSRRNGQDYCWSTCVLLSANQITRVDKILYGWRERIGSSSYVAFRKRTIDYVVVKRHALECVIEKASHWAVPYAASMFSSCLDAAIRKPSLSDPEERKRYDSEIRKALSLFAKISIFDILGDPYTKKRRKALAVIGKISFPLACFIKKTVESH